MLKSLLIVAMLIGCGKPPDEPDQASPVTGSPPPVSAAVPAQAQDPAPASVQAPAALVQGFQLSSRAVSLGSKWDDVWKDGGGFSLSYTHLLRKSDGLLIGTYTGFSHDRFEGERRAGPAKFLHSGHHDDGDDDHHGPPPGPSPTPTTIKAESLEMTRVFFGVRAREMLGEKAYIEQHLGTGFAFYEGSSGLVDKSAAFTFEGGIRAGILVSDKFDLSAGWAYEMNRSADDAGAVDFGRQDNAVFTVALGLRF